MMRISKRLSLLFGSLVLFFVCHSSFFRNGASRSPMRGPMELTHESNYVFIVAVFVTYIPITAMVYFYGSLINGPYFSKTICSETTSGERDAEKSKLVVTFLLVSAGFCIGYGPFAIFYTILAAGYDKQTGFFLYSVLSSVYLYFQR